MPTSKAHWDENAASQENTVSPVDLNQYGRRMSGLLAQKAREY
jgi:hypothetical protein